jgi:hypothetical protein
MVGAVSDKERADSVEKLIDELRVFGQVAGEGAPMATS